MINAKDELLHFIQGKSHVKCASILNSTSWNYDKDHEDGAKIILRVNYSKEDWDKFLSKLDFEYDNGFGGQQLFGTVWLNDDTWLSRGEYDGSEWWEHNHLPEIPLECIFNQSLQ